jgi:hypothetical protein
LNKFMQNGLQTMLIANIAHCNLVRKQRYKVVSGAQKNVPNLCKIVNKQCLLQTLPISTLCYWANTKNYNKLMQNGLHTMVIANIAHCKDC